jgi:protein-S-isoprenylcysteine O-methyltransferase Ste14
VEQLFTAVRAAVYAAGFIWVWWWAAMRVRPLDARLGVEIPDWLVPVGAVLAVIGGLLALSCVAVFVHFGRGTAAPFDPPREFVAVGPYRLVRNPMYVGGLAVILGAGLFLRSASVTAFTFVFLVVMHLFVVLYEERTLERRFGASYIQYKQHVHRWLPKSPGDPPIGPSDHRHGHSQQKLS